MLTVLLTHPNHQCTALPGCLRLAKVCSGHLFLLGWTYALEPAIPLDGLATPHCHVTIILPQVQLLDISGDGDDIHHDGCATCCPWPPDPSGHEVFNCRKGQANILVLFFTSGAELQHYGQEPVFFSGRRGEELPSTAQKTMARQNKPLFDIEHLVHSRGSPMLTLRREQYERSE